MAKTPEGALVDPFNGKKDLEARVLRHVSEAFAEDPVRILRVARFAARFGFDVAQETLALMKSMVASGETDYLVPERVWQEFSKGLLEEHPERMFAVLELCGLLQKFLPELKPDPALLGRAAQEHASLPVRFALLTFRLDEGKTAPVCERLRAPNDVRELALTASRNRERLLAVPAASAVELLELLKRADAFRRPERFRELLQVARIAAPETPMSRVEEALAAASAVDAGAIAAGAGSPAEIPKLIDAARTRAIAEAV
jgi:tRNA nucleotidyltransferase (CCA-adding enzyme)